MQKLMAVLAIALAVALPAPVLAEPPTLTVLVDLGLD